MSSEPPTARYLLHPPDLQISPDVERALESFGVEGTLTIDAVPEDLPAKGGWLILPPDLGYDVVGRILVELAWHPDPWCLLLLTRDEAVLRVLPLSPGYPDSPERTATRLDTSSLDCGYLNHRQLLKEIARIRHDLNNALTSGLAETQFLRMDAPGGSELAGGLAVVEAQLERIRALSEALAALRVPHS